MSANAVISASLCCALAATAYLVHAVLRPRRGMVVSLGVLGLAMAGAVCWRSQNMALYSDVPFHLSLIRATADRGPFPGDPFFRGLPTPLHYSLLHIVGGAVFRLTGSLGAAWAALGCLVLALAWGVGYATGGTLFEDRRFAPLLATLYVVASLATGMLPVFGWTALVLAGAAYPVVARAARRGVFSAASAAGAGALLGLALTVRLYEGLVGWIAVLLACMVLAFRGETRMPPAAWFALLAMPAAVAAPWISNALCQTGSAESFAPLAVGSAARSYVADIPRVLLEPFRHLPLRPVRNVAVALWLAGAGLALWGRGIPRFGLIVLRPAAGLALVLALLPWRAVLAAGGADSYRTFRMMEIVGRGLLVFPPELALGVVLASLPALLPAAGGRQTAARLAAAALLAAALLGPAMRLRLKMEYGARVRPRLEYVYAGKAALLDLPRGVVVLSDAWTSYMIQHVLGCFCVTTPSGHATSLVDVQGRSASIESLFAGEMGEARARAFLRVHGCGYVLVNKPLASGASIENFERTAVEYRGYRPEHLDRLPFLAKVIEDEDVALYRVERERRP